MSELPEYSPVEAQDPPSPTEAPASNIPIPAEAASNIDAIAVSVGDTPASRSNDDPLLFQRFAVVPPQERIPHMGHIGILILMALGGLVCAILIAHAAVSYHLFGVTNLNDASTDFHYTLGTEGIFYLLTFLGALVVFPLFWHKSLLAGLQWRAHAALRCSGYLISTALVCFVLAMVDGILMPGPTDAPIDRIFRVPGAAWFLFVFGVTAAPFFEEIAFRGFLLPALATAFDWIAEQAADQPSHQVDENGHPRWSMTAIVTSSILTSILFALMHADQTGHSFGPFLLLLCISLILCAARILTRSLAATVLVHATYNFLLFSFMLLAARG
jgi:membrane protease YdiL (CAAX protease family)